jgi:Zn-dependent protease with chaperone function
VSLDGTAALLAVLVAALLGPASTSLARAHWVLRAPRAAIALWQALGVSALLSGIGAGVCVAVERFHRGVVGGVADLVDGATRGHPLAGLGLPDALGLTLAADLVVVLVCLLTVVTARTAVSRSRHRHLVDLLALRTHDSGAAVLDHPAAVAYCVPGIRPRIVISAGTVALLDDGELAAVVEHERGHASERHGLVMMPMVGLGKLFGWVPYADLAPAAVACLLEMAADDYSTRRHDRTTLVSALVSMATAGAAPACSFALNGGTVAIRVERLLSGRPRSRRAAATAGAACVAAVALPLAILFTL